MQMEPPIIKMKRILIFVLSLVAAAGLIYAGRFYLDKKHPDAPTSEKLISLEEAYAQIPETVREHITEEKIDIGIDAVVQAESLRKITETTLAFSDNYLQQLISDKILTEYPGVIEQRDTEGNRRWECYQTDSLAESYTLMEEGMFGYLDHMHNQNHPLLDDGHIFEYAYFTNHVLADIPMNMMDCADDCREYLETYSDLTYRPWNILAYGEKSGDEEQGCYEIQMQAFLDGIPISEKACDNMQPLTAAATYSKDGMIELQGILCK